MQPSIENVEFLGVTIKFEVPVERHLYDLGSLHLVCEDRNFVLDVCQSYTNDECTEIRCELEVDTETFPLNQENNYQLTANDLMSNISGTLYIGQEWEERPESMTLFVKICGMTKAIDLEIE